MPFFLIPFALGLSFLLIWTIIGGMIFHDGQAVARHDIDAGFAICGVRRRKFAIAPLVAVELR
jgi:hypothetical protein